MPFYNDTLLPRIQNRIMDNTMMRTRRRAVCADLEGDVLEIGFGTGHNVPFYPDSVTGVWAVDPSGTSFALARKRLARSSIEVHRAGLDGQTLDLPDARFDAALSTWTMCTIPDPAAALQEVWRVLRPGARFSFVEHGLAPDANVVRKQHRLEPLQRRVAGGCHLTREIASLVEQAGFTIDALDLAYERPKTLGYMYQGTARKPAEPAGAARRPTSTGVSR